MKGNLADHFKPSSSVKHRGCHEQEDYYYFLTALGLCCCERPFSSCREQGLLFFRACRLLIALVSLVRAWALWHVSFSCGAQTSLHSGMWNFPGPGIKPMSSALAHGFSSSFIPFSSCPQSFPASGSFPRSQLCASGGQSVGVSASASVLPMNIQG